MPSWEIFEKQDEGYKDFVLPQNIGARISVEAGVTLGWERYVGFKGASVGIDRFGASAPGETVLERLGVNPEKVANETLELLGRSERVEEGSGTPAVEDTSPEEGHS
jgi:transketolase